jgi:hypothetical protein
MWFNTVVRYNNSLSSLPLSLGLSFGLCHLAFAADELRVRAPRAVRPTDLTRRARKMWVQQAIGLYVPHYVRQMNKQERTERERECIY